MLVPELESEVVRRRVKQTDVAIPWITLFDIAKPLNRLFLYTC